MEGESRSLAELGWVGLDLVGKSVLTGGEREHPPPLLYTSFCHHSAPAIGPLDLVYCASWLGMTEERRAHFAFLNSPTCSFDASRSGAYALILGSVLFPRIAVAAADRVDLMGQKSNCLQSSRDSAGLANHAVAFQMHTASASSHLPFPTADGQADGSKPCGLLGPIHLPFPACTALGAC
jgi:hypothetical protein